MTMAFTNRCRPQYVAAIVRRVQENISSSPAPLISRRSHSLLDVAVSPGRPFGNVLCLNPSYGGVLGNRELVRHFSWWRWGGSNSVPNSAIQPDNGDDQTILEPSSSALDEIGAGNGNGAEQIGSEAFPWQSKVDVIEDEIHRPERALPSIDHADGMLEGGGGSGAFWSTLQIPVDAIVVTLDRFQTFTQVPW